MGRVTFWGGSGPLLSRRRGGCAIKENREASLARAAGVVWSSDSSASAELGFCEALDGNPWKFWDCKSTFHAARALRLEPNRW